MMTPVRDQSPHSVHSDSSYNLTYRMMDDEIEASKNRRGKVPIFEFAFQLLKSAKENHSIELLMFFHMIGYTCTTVIGIES